MQNRLQRLDSDNLSGILTRGGTILGTSRAKLLATSGSPSATEFSSPQI